MKVMPIKTITYNGETLLISEWAEIYNLSAAVINMRLNRGWSAERCLLGQKHISKRFDVNGESLTILEISKKYDINQATLYDRIAKGWSPEKVIDPGLSKAGVHRGVNEFNFMMRRFYTKEQRLESYKRLITEMKEQRMKRAA